MRASDHLLPSALVVLTVSVCFPALVPAANSNSAAAFKARNICNTTPGLAPKQRNICRKRLDAIPTIGEGVQRAIHECQHQFRNRRWNCSSMEPINQMLGLSHRVASRQAAYSTAVTAAGIAYSITQACSLGRLRNCGCDHSKQAKRKKKNRQAREGWTWGGCSADVKYGIRFAKRFLDAGEFSENARSLMNIHNNRAGRKAVKQRMGRECKCHGVSGSCSMETCWSTLPPFRRIGDHLSKRFHRSKMVVPYYGDRNRRPVSLTLKKSKIPHKKPRKADLVYLEKEPNYCDYNESTGSFGTVGRKCNRKSDGLDGCYLMCCGRGYNTHQYIKTEPCNCKFHWCCFVQCSSCSNRTEEYTCK